MRMGQKKERATAKKGFRDVTVSIRYLRAP